MARVTTTITREERMRANSAVSKAASVAVARTSSVANKEAMVAANKAGMVEVSRAVMVEAVLTSLAAEVWVNRVATVVASKVATAEDVLTSLETRAWVNKVALAALKVTRDATTVRRTSRATSSVAMNSENTAAPATGKCCVMTAPEWSRTDNYLEA